MERELKYVAHIPAGQELVFCSMRQAMKHRPMMMVAKHLPDGSYLLMSDKKIDKPVTNPHLVTFGEIKWMPCGN